MEKYNIIKEHLLKALGKKITHTDLMIMLYSRVKDKFEGGVLKIAGIKKVPPERDPYT